MFGLGLPEIIVILVIFLFLFGAKRLPQIGEGLGKTVRELRRIRDDRRRDEARKKADKEAKENVVSDIRREVEEIPGVKVAKEIKETAEELKKVTKFLR